MYRYIQLKGGEEQWQPIPLDMIDEVVQQSKPRYSTVLAVSEVLPADVTPDIKLRLNYSGPMYLDWDSESVEDTIPQVIKLLENLRDNLHVDPESVYIYATGGRGFHVEVPQHLFMAKIPKGGVNQLPAIYKELALELAVDTLDLRVYSAGRGRMWRTPNVERENGRYKVPISWDELQVMTGELYLALTSAPRPALAIKPAGRALGLTVLFDTKAKYVQEKVKARKNRKNATAVLSAQSLPSLEALMAGKGIKASVGFHQLAMQLGIVADAMRWTEDELVAKCAGLIASHSSDGQRYNTVERREQELRRMHRYTADNVCYEFSVGALKVLLAHDAPDLDGIPVSKAQVLEDIERAEKLAELKAATETDSGDSEPVPDEYDDIAGGVTLTKYGVYTSTEEGGKKRICALSFDKVDVLKSADTGLVEGYEANVLVNGKVQGRQSIDPDIFSGLQSFNRFCAKMAHAMQGQDHHVRGVMLRVAQQAQKEGRTQYVVKREGLDVIALPTHEDEELRRPFLVWADATGVVLEPRVSAKNLNMVFRGYPDPRGLFRTDLAQVSELSSWLEEGDNKEHLRIALHSFMTCQKPDVISNLLGWYTACFWRMLFHRAYDKFPLLHVNGPAGSGKTEMNKTLLSLFYGNEQGKMLTPQSSLFSLTQQMAGSASIPLIVDEYKPHEMNIELHNKLKLLWRDAYNCRDITKGGGNRDNSDYRALHTTQISAPVCFIAEVMEEEPATMERVVLVTVVRPPSSVALDWSAKFSEFRRYKHVLSPLGNSIASAVVNTYSVERLRDEFEPMYEAAKRKYMLNPEDVSNPELDHDELKAKQGAKERTVFNFTVSLYGLQRFRQLIDEIFGPDEFRIRFDDLESHVYSRMTDLLPATKAEYLKVFDVFAQLSYGDPLSPTTAKLGLDYALVRYENRDAVELAPAVLYNKYRIHCRALGIRPLFPGEQAFRHALKDSAALLKANRIEGATVQTPGGAYVFDTEELRRLGVESFKGAT